MIETTRIAVCDICGTKSEAFGLWREFRLGIKTKKDFEGLYDYIVCESCYPKPQHHEGQTVNAKNLFQRMIQKLKPQTKGAQGNE